MAHRVYADDLVLISIVEQKLVSELNWWKDGLENIGKRSLLMKPKLLEMLTYYNVLQWKSKPNHLHIHGHLCLYSSP